MVDQGAQKNDVRTGADRKCLSATALVRVNLGSTWMTFAPRAFASATH